ncbi:MULTISPECIES: hypothetical protein [Oscillatoriales]|uniref:Uncharacterized protein n=2 Tax=Limnospira TaxID=2596745 RepID=A0A9P1KG90_9CYAN|nr:hypothetical protein [Limnospira indica]EKD06388.1 hypothetical protein SPLC1_S543330 [Arthrospira platensis C1]CDM94878.1 conserved protein of unknown function [Limnospira indica PCC 8005]
MEQDGRAGLDQAGQFGSAIAETQALAVRIFQLLRGKDEVPEV